MWDPLNTINNTSPSQEATSNFRAFKDGKYGEPFAKTNGAVVVYSAVSIMSALFAKFLSVRHMMFETDQAYADAVMPIVHLCGDTLQENTEPLLHDGSKVAHSIDTARQRWEANYAPALKELEKHKGTEPNHVVAYWDQFIDHPDYAAIRKFVGIIMTPEVPTEESLTTAFPNASFAGLKELHDDIRKINIDIAQKVQVNAGYFASGNEKLLKKQREKQREKQQSDREADYRKEQEEFYDTKLSLGAAAQQLKAPSYLTPKELQKKIEKDIKDEQQIKILKATYAYLGAEFAVFLLLAFVTNAQQIASQFKLTSKSGSEILLPDQIVTPVLSYPISASQNAENTFNIFTKVEGLYHKYAERLDLPVIKEFLAIVDSVVPKSVSHPSKAKPGVLEGLNTNNTSSNHSSPASSSPTQDDGVSSEQGDSQLPMIVGTPPSDIHIGCLVPTTNKVIGSATSSPGLPDSPPRTGSLFSTGHTMYPKFSNTAEGKERLDETTKKIFSLLEDTLDSLGEDMEIGEQMERDYQNGISCKIIILKNKQEDSKAKVRDSLGEEKKQKQLQSMHNLIRGVVSSALDGAADKASLPYHGCKVTVIGGQSDDKNRLMVGQSNDSAMQQLRGGVSSFPLIGGTACR